MTAQKRLVSVAVVIATLLVQDVCVAAQVGNCTKHVCDQIAVTRKLNTSEQTKVNRKAIEGHQANIVRGDEVLKKHYRARDLAQARMNQLQAALKNMDGIFILKKAGSIALGGLEIGMVGLSYGKFIAPDVTGACRLGEGLIRTGALIACESAKVVSTTRSIVGALRQICAGKVGGTLAQCIQNSLKGLKATEYVIVQPSGIGRTLATITPGAGIVNGFADLTWNSNVIFKEIESLKGLLDHIAGLISRTYEFIEGERRAIAEHDQVIKTLAQVKKVSCP